MKPIISIPVLPHTFLKHVTKHNVTSKIFSEHFESTQLINYIITIKDFATALDQKFRNCTMNEVWYKIMDKKVYICKT